MADELHSQRCCDYFSECPLSVVFVELNPLVTISAGWIQASNRCSAECCYIVASVMDLRRGPSAKPTLAIVCVHRQCADGLPQLAVEILLISRDTEVTEKLMATLVSFVWPVSDSLKHVGECSRVFVPAIRQDSRDGDSVIDAMRLVLVRTVETEQGFICQSPHLCFRLGRVGSRPHAVGIGAL